MKLPEKFFANALGSMFGILWALFGFWASANEALVIGCALIVLTALAQKFEVFSGALLLLFGISSSFLIASSPAAAVLKPLLYILISLPPFASGLLFIIHWHERIADHRK